MKCEEMKVKEKCLGLQEKSNILLGDVFFLSNLLAIFYLFTDAFSSFFLLYPEEGNALLALSLPIHLYEEECHGKFHCLTRSY
uniref:Uncharacterized protein n=1 Tax=Phlebotomus papatasi TaxID=29031 RepID=A0A1B0DAS1_PHLPP